MLNLSDRIPMSHTSAVFAAANDPHRICMHAFNIISTLFYMPRSNGTFVLTINPKTTYRFNYVHMQFHQLVQIY
jgi:hypothetical protein